MVYVQLSLGLTVSSSLGIGKGLHQERFLVLSLAQSWPKSPCSVVLIPCLELHSLNCTLAFNINEVVFGVHRGIILSTCLSLSRNCGWGCHSPVQPCRCTWAHWIGWGRTLRATWSLDFAPYSAVRAPLKTTATKLTFSSYINHVQQG